MDESAKASASGSVNPDPRDMGPEKEKLNRWRKIQMRLRAASGAVPLIMRDEDGADIVAEQPSRIVMRKPWSPRVRRIVMAGAFVLAVSLASVMGVWHHFSREAAQYDLASLQRMSQGTRVLDRQGKFVSTVFSQDRKFINISEAPPQLVDALIATEDGRFYNHGGIDVKSVFRAFTVNLSSGSVRQGASTITQQLARQAFQLRGRTLHRKMLETFIAWRLEQAYTKPQILEFYLNQIYLGSGFYGVGAAARGYFGKEVKDLTLEESALIVGIIKAPVAYSPTRAPNSALRVRNLTLDRMATMGMISAVQRDAAKAAEIKVLADDQRAYRPEYLIAAVEREMETKHSREHPSQVTLTVDVTLQARLQDVLKRHAERVEKSLTNNDAGTASKAPAKASVPPLQAAVVVLKNHTGEILATIGGRDYRTSPFDRALQGQRPAGTAFLPLTYAAMFSVSPDAAASWVLDGPLDNRRVMIGGTEGILGEWGAEPGQGVYEGQISALYALYGCKTGATVRLGYQAGVDGVKARLEKCGFDSKLRDQPSLLLGSSSMRLIELARGYATLANGGQLTPDPVLVAAADGNDWGKAPPGSTEAFAPPAAEVVRATLIAAMKRPQIVTVLRGHGLDHEDLMGYGGTAYGFTDAWFVGSNQDVTCAVWLGYDLARTMGKGASSVQTALPFWAEAMKEVVAATGGKGGWPKVAGSPVLCLRSGTVATPACKQSGDPLLTETGLLTGPGNSRGNCLFHAPANVVRAVSVSETEEVWIQPHDRERAAMDSRGVRPVHPMEPVVLGPDVYHTLGQGKVMAKPER